MSEIPPRNGGEARQNGHVLNGHAQSFLLSDVIGWKVRTKAGVKLGKLKDFVAKDDPKYAEVTHLIVGRPYGDPSLKIPWSEVLQFGPHEIVVQNPPEGTYAEIGPDENLLLLRAKVLDKRVLDTTGFAVEVVYDIQLLLVENKTLHGGRGCQQARPPAETRPRQARWGPSYGPWGRGVHSLEVRPAPFTRPYAHQGRRQTYSR